VTKDAVHSPRQTRSEGLHATGEITLSRGLHERMQMVGLDRIVHDAELPALARSHKAALHLSHELHGPQRRQSASHLQRHVTREARRERSSRAVRVARLRARFATGTHTPPAPTRGVTKIES
jgi:hypothetical protein